MTNNGGTNSTRYGFTVTQSTYSNQWVHLAVVRNGNVFTMYLNGTSVGTTTNSATLNTVNQPFCVGGAKNASNALKGYLSNFRVVKGVAVYTGTFTVPTTPLTATQSAGTNISAITYGQTILLTAQSTTFIDNSIYNRTISVVGNVVTSGYISSNFTGGGSQPFPVTAVSAGTASLAIKSDGTLYAWGLNTNYQIGSASYYLNQSISSPVQIGTLSVVNTSRTVGTGSGAGSFVKNI